MKNALGRGLASLLDDVDTGQLVAGVDLVDPNPFQPRRIFDEESIKSLANSIRERGVIQPILVREKDGGRYELIAGERRLRAAKMAELDEVPIIVREISDKDSLELAILENIQREELNPIDEADGYARLVKDFGHTQEDISKFTGKSRSYIANAMRLLGLPEFTRNAVASGRLSVGHAKLALATDDPDAFAEEVMVGGLTVREAEKIVAAHKVAVKTASKTVIKELNSEDSQNGSIKPNDAEIAALEEEISSLLGLRSQIKWTGKSGTVLISFDNLLQLDAILKKLMNSDV